MNRKRIILSFFFFLASLILISCKNEKANVQVRITNPNPVVVKDPYPLDKEGWLNREVFQVLESMSSSDSTPDLALFQERAMMRSAKLLALSRYKIFKEDFQIIQDLYKFQPFQRAMTGKVVFSEVKDGNFRGVYRVEQKDLIRRVKRVMNAFEELNPGLRKKIKEGDLTF